MRVAIHQPNFLPWPGFFAKMAQADVFVLLDDVQFSKNNIINRVRILGPGQPRWLTLPVSAHLGQAINAVMPGRADWQQSLLSLLRNTYQAAPHFKAVWPELVDWFNAAPATDLAGINAHFIRQIAARFELGCRFVTASALDVVGQADDRLVAIVSRLAPGGTYLSGRGGAGYQDPAKFAAAGIQLAYYRFTPESYPQGPGDFQPGLSVVDALFFLGWDGARKMICVT